MTVKRPPEWYWLPMADSQSVCYHAKCCGAHLLEPVPREDALEIIGVQNLRPCGNCMQHHGLTPIED